MFFLGAVEELAAVEELWIFFGCLWESPCRRLMTGGFRAGCPPGRAARFMQKVSVSKRSANKTVCGGRCAG
jgi:hypothetical protein